MLIGVLNDVSEATACGRSTPAGGPGEAVPPEGGGGTGRDGTGPPVPPARRQRGPGLPPPAGERPQRLGKAFP